MEQPAAVGLTPPEVTNWGGWIGPNRLDRHLIIEACSGVTSDQPVFTRDEA